MKNKTKNFEIDVTGVKKQRDKRHDRYFKDRAITFLTNNPQFRNSWTKEHYGI